MIKTFRELFRQNTGTHVTDSGGQSGRGWQQPAITGETVAWFDQNCVDGDELCATIETAIFLEQNYKIDVELLDRISAEGFASVGDFFEAIGYEEARHANTGNGENNLSQNFMFRAWTKPEFQGDWIYGHDKKTNGLNDVYITISAHTGADLRVGYSDEVPLSQGPGATSALPYNLVVGARIIAAWDEDGDELEIDSLDVGQQSWEVGNSTYPLFHLSQSIAKVAQVSEDGQTATVILKTGEKVTVGIDVRG